MVCCWTKINTAHLVVPVAPDLDWNECCMVWYYAVNPEMCVDMHLRIIPSHLKVR